MRENKYKVWCKDRNEWEKDQSFLMPNGMLCYQAKTSLHGLRLYKPENHIAVFYTGMKDKSGKEIFEADIVTCSMSFEGGTLPHIGEIVYDNTFGAFATKNESGVTLLHNHCLHTIEVIGNIYENPELLK